MLNWNLLTELNLKRLEEIIVDPELKNRIEATHKKLMEIYKKKHKLEKLYNKLIHQAMGPGTTSVFDKNGRFRLYNNLPTLE